MAFLFIAIVTLVLVGVTASVLYKVGSYVYNDILLGRAETRKELEELEFLVTKLEKIKHDS